MRKLFYLALALIFLDSCQSVTDRESCTYVTPEETELKFDKRDISFDTYNGYKRDDVDNDYVLFINNDASKEFVRNKLKNIQITLPDEYDLLYSTFFIESNFIDSETLMDHTKAVILYYHYDSALMASVFLLNSNRKLEEISELTHKVRMIETNSIYNTFLHLKEKGIISSPIVFSTYDLQSHDKKGKILDRELKNYFKKISSNQSSNKI